MGHLDAPYRKGGISVAVAKITSKGQITLPKMIRDILKLNTGDCVDLVLQSNNEVLLRPKTLSLASLQGSLPLKGKAISVKEMATAIHKTSLRHHPK